MVETYIHTYYAIEYMHGAPLFCVLLAKYAAPVLFLLLCVYFVFRYREKRRESEKPAQVDILPIAKTRGFTAQYDKWHRVEAECIELV